MSRSSIAVLALAAVLVAGLVGGYAWLRRGTSPAGPQASPAPTAPPTTVAHPPADVASASTQASAPASAALVEPRPVQPLDAASVPDALSELFGREVVAQRLQTDDLALRIAATTDNLLREHASSRLWPVVPPSGRFTVTQREGRTYIDADNALRYTPLVLMMETVDLHHLVSVYSRMYPLLQSAYVELGYPNGRFHERLLNLIDHLLATPEPTGPLEVVLPDEATGPVKPERPWVLYRFADPKLEALSAGQKILLRVGIVNERRLKARLVGLRRALQADTSGHL